MKTNLFKTAGLIILLIVSSNIFAQIQTSASFQNCICPGDSLGAIDVTVTGGTAPYTYYWETTNGGGLIPTDEDQTGLIGGTYNLTVTDATSTEQSSSIEILEPDNFMSVPTILNNHECYGDCRNEILADVLGGTYPFSYLWNTGDTTNLIDSLCGGQYILSITDAHNCSFIDTFMIVQNEFPLELILDTIINATNGICNGLIDFDISGGQPHPSNGYNVYCNSTLIPVDTIVENLCAGSYNLFIRDVSGVLSGGDACTLDTTVTILNLYGTTPTNFTDTVNITIDTCIFNQAIPIDSAFISGYDIITADSILTNWVFWQAGSSILLDVGINISGLGTYPLIYLEIVCNNKALVTNKFYGRLDLTTGIGTVVDIIQIKIYPNPAKEYINISLINKNNSIANLSLVDISGKTLLQKEFSQETKLNVKNIKNGVYFLRIESNDRLLIEKIIINR